MLGAEERLRALARELLDLVDDLAAAVVALAGVALGVLVRRRRADRLEHARPGEVLGRDQLDLAALPLELAPEQCRRSRGRPRRAPPSEAARTSPARSPSRRQSSSRRLTPRRRAGAHPLRSPPRAGAGALAEHARLATGEVDHRRRRARERAGVELGRAAARGCAPGTSSRVAGLRLARLVRARRRDRADRVEHALRASAAARRRARRSCRRASPVEPGVAARRDSAARACTAPAAARGRSRSERPRSSGTHSSSMSTLEAIIAVGCASAAALQLVEPRAGSSRYGRRAEPVDAVGRAAAPAGRRESPSIALATSLGPHRASTTRSRPGEIPDEIVRLCVAELRRAPTRSRAARILVALEHERSRASTGARVARRAARSGPSSTSASARLPVAHLGLERRRARRRRRTAGSRRRGRTGPSRPASRSVSTSSTLEAEPLGVLAGERERVRRDVGRGHARVRALVARSRARSRRCPVPTSTTRGASMPASSASAALDDDLGLGPRHERARVGLAASGGGSPSRRARRRAAPAGRAARRARARPRARPRSAAGRAACRARAASRPSARERISSASSRGVSTPLRARYSVVPREHLAERHPLRPRARGAARRRSARR